jgi:hypothetical protein
MIKNILSGFLLFSACNDNDGDNSELKDPALTQPPSEAIPDSTKIINDSVIMPVAKDSSMNRGIADSSSKMRH